MLRSAPLLLLACTGKEPTEVSDPPSVPTAAPPTPLVPCGAAPTPFSFAAGREPLFQPPPQEVTPRTYLGRVTVPEDLAVDLTAMWLLDQPVTITGTQTVGTNQVVNFEVQATCTTCDHASLRLGSISSGVVLTSGTQVVGDPVNASFSLDSTAYMALGLSTGGGGPATASPNQDPALNPFVADIRDAMRIEIELNGTTGVTVHGQPRVGFELWNVIDLLLADAQVATVPPLEVPWLLPIAQAGVAEELVIWGPEGRSAGLAAVDGRFLVELPLNGTPADYVLRFAGPAGQGLGARLRYPPDVGPGVVEIRTLQGEQVPLLDVRSAPETWVALRGEGIEPVVCRADADGRSLFARPDGGFELVVLDPETLTLEAQRICTQEGALDCR